MRPLHLGHVLSFDLNDDPDLICVLKDFNRKANCVLCTFHAADCFVKCFLIKLYCLSLWLLPVASWYSFFTLSSNRSEQGSCEKFGIYLIKHMFLLYSV